MEKTHTDAASQCLDVYIHQCKTPLATLEMSLEILGEHLRSGEERMLLKSDAKTQQLLQASMNSVRKLRDLLDAMDNKYNEKI
jgi:hypothetical protein